MTRRERPPRSWDVKNLMVLGERGGVAYLKAIPILILEKWVREGREEGVANFVWTNQLAERLVSSGLVSPFKPKGTSNVLAALTVIQKSRNLTRPILIEYRGEGMYWLNLPHYEPLLQKYRQEYRKDYSEDYKKLFPDEEPEWGSLPSTGRVEPREAKPTLAKSEEQDEIQSLLAPVEQALRDRQQYLERLTNENQKLQAKLVVLQADLQERREVPRHRIVDEELRNDCAEFLKKEDTYVDAIRRAGVVLEERLKKAIGGNGPEKFKQGVDLVDYALRKDSGQLSISDHPAEQEGVHMLFRGAVQFVRNPPSHKKMLYTEVEAVQAIGLIDYLLLLLRQAKLREI